MVVYLDTSSLVKLYVEEQGSEQVGSLVKASSVVATSIVSYAEARAAFARRFREKSFKAAEYKRIKNYLNNDWKRYLVLNITDDIVVFAGNLAEKHALRAYDSIHLASALNLRNTLSSSIIFSCFDNRLQQAFKREKHRPDSG